MMRVQWTEVDAIGRGDGGHGVDITATPDKDGPVIAFIHGYDWLHGKSDVARVSISPKSADRAGVDLDDVKGVIHNAVQCPAEFSPGVLGTRFFAWFNA